MQTLRRIISCLKKDWSIQMKTALFSKKNYVVCFLLLFCVSFILNKSLKLSFVTSGHKIFSFSKIAGRVLSAGDDKPNTWLEIVRKMTNRTNINTLSHKQIQEFYHKYVDTAQIKCNQTMRQGSYSDGGYNLCLDQKYFNKSNCIVYSFGINYDFGFDSAMKRQGCDVYSFDPSMTKVVEDYKKQPDGVHFYKLGIGEKHSIIQKGQHIWKILPLSSIREFLKHNSTQKQLSVLKIDIEGMESKVLEETMRTNSIRDVKQLIFEIHLSLGNKDNPAREKYLSQIHLFKKLYQYGFRIFSTVHNLGTTILRPLSGKKPYACNEIHMLNINFI